MTVCLGDYTPAKRRYIRSQGWSCVFLYGHDQQIRLGETGDIVRRSRSISRENGEPSIHFVWWTPGRPVAWRVIGETRLAIAGSYRRDTCSYEMPWIEIVETIRKVSAKTFPTLSFFDHLEMVKVLRRMNLNKGDSRRDGTQT